MSLPRASRRRCRPTTTTRSVSDTGDQLVAKGGNAALKGRVARGGPVGTVSPGYGIGPREGDEQHVVLVMAVVARYAGTIAGRGERDGGLAHHCMITVIAILVSPDPVDLCSLVSVVISGVSDGAESCKT
jgi:hypothetical protein